MLRSRPGQAAMQCNSRTSTKHRQDVRVSMGGSAARVAYSTHGAHGICASRVDTRLATVYVSTVEHPYTVIVQLLHS